MKKRARFYVGFLTSVVCMLGYSLSAFSAVRILGSGNNTVVGASGASTDTGAKVSNTTSAVTQNTRGSSLRFSNATQVAGAAASQSYSGLSGTGTATVTDTPAARLSIGKYLNLSHSTKPVSGGGQSSSGGSGSGASSADVSNLQTQIDRLQTAVEGLKTDKQNALIVGEGEYIDISGPDDNIVSIDVEALKSDLQAALNTDKELLTEIDEDYKLFWCYANADKTGCANEKQLVVDLGKVLTEADLASENVSLSDALAGKQGKLTTTDAGYIAIDEQVGTIDVKFNKLKEDLGISDAKESEIRFTQDGKLQWRYADEYETDAETGERVKKWNTADVDALIKQNLNGYVQAATLDNYVLKSQLVGLQGALTPAADGYIQIVNNEIGVKFDALKTALGISGSQEKIEMEITNAGALRWRYLDDFEQDGETKKWTTVSVNIGDLIDGKLANYVDNTSLATSLENYITSAQLSTELQDYALKTYVDTELAKKQVKLTEANDGFIAITALDGGGEKIGIKFNDLKEALGIDSAHSAEIRVDNGVLQWRYMDEFESEPDAVTGERVKKWTNVFDLNSLLNGYVSENNFNTVINRIDGDLAGKQIKLTPAEEGYIILNEQTGEIAIDMAGLRTYLSIEANNSRTSEMRVFDGKLQWRYMDEYEIDDQDNRVQVWHTLDLTAVELPLYVKKAYLTSNYYNKIYIDNLARTIENNINVSLASLWPEDNGLYLISISGANGENKTWQKVQIVDGDGVVH